MERLTEVLAAHYSADPHLDEIDETFNKDDLVRRAAIELTEEELIDAVFDGFTDRYSQWTYCRNLSTSAPRVVRDQLMRLTQAQPSEHVMVVAAKSLRRGWLSVLLQMKQELRCEVSSDLVPQNIATTRSVHYPCLLTYGKGKLFIQVMTVSPSDWRPFLGRDVRATYGTITHDAGRDHALSFLHSNVNFSSPDAYDFTSAARNLISLDDVYVADVTGHFIVNTGQAGDLRIEAALSTEDEMSGVESLFSDEFDKIMKADSLRSARIQARSLVRGIPSGRFITVLPMDGRVQIGSMLQGGDLYAFLDYLVS